MSDYVAMNSVHDPCVDVKGRVIFLHGEMEDKEESDPGTDWRMANRFMKNMYLLDRRPSDTIIHQHNIGGDWESGMSIYDMISQSPSNITVLCHGEVMSMGTVILQAADNRIAMPNCTFMFHYGAGGVYEDWKKLESYVDAGRAQNTQMLDIYVERCQHGEAFQGRTLKQIRRTITEKFAFKTDWYLTAEGAKYYGFIDAIIGEDLEMGELYK